jgi:tripartite-type tricarboxylate transporter receptor subunit TctC
MTRSSRWLVAACASPMAVVPGPTSADTFPNRPIRFVVPFPGWDTSPWFGIMMWAGTPDAVVR